MSNVDVIRAWKEANYRKGLSREELASLPQNPAGLIDLSDTELEGVTGGLAAGTEYVLTLGCCGGLTASTCGCSFGCGSNTCYRFTWCANTVGCGTRTQVIEDQSDEMMY
jgi:mersacidin/lichenicidin family type 2 lantibiotic